MSMQQQAQPEAEIVKHRMMTSATIKKVTESIIAAEPININMFLVILVSGIGGLFNISFGWQWYIIVFAVIIIFALDKFNILKGWKEEEVIIRKENPNSLD